jgi:cell wall-associated NlpC family hydrolase
MLDRHAILTTLESLIGVPFMHRGRSRFGVDCLGLVMLVAHEHGIALEDVAAYPLATSGEWMREECQRQLVDIPQGQIAPGDVVQWAEVWRTPKAPPCNLAFVGWAAGRQTLIHATVRHQRVVAHDLSPLWRTAIVWAYQLPGVAPWLSVVEG